MKRTRLVASLLCAVLLGTSSGSALAQQILLKSGQRVDTLGLRRDGDTIMGKIRVGNSNGEIGYQVAAIEKIEFPEPKPLKPAAELLAQGQAEKALAEIDPVVTYYAPFKDIPGAWWAPAALIRMSALSALQRDAEAEPLAAEIQKNATDPETARAASLRLVTGLIRKQEYDKAAELCDKSIKESVQADVLALAWLKKGDVLFAQKTWDEALMAYLHVPVFYSTDKLAMPQALLGAARAYHRLDDADRARKAFKELTTSYPKSAEATIAQAEMSKIK